MNSCFVFNNLSKYLKQYIIEILINLDYYNFIIFNKFNSINNNYNSIYNNNSYSSNTNNNKAGIKLNNYSKSYEIILNYGLVCNEWFILVSNGMKYLSSNIKIKRYSEKCLINPFQIKYYIQECYFKYKREEYGFLIDEGKLLNQFPNIQQIRYLITMDYSSDGFDQIESQDFILNYPSGNEPIFQIKSITNLKKSSKSKITLFIVSPTTLEPLAIKSYLNNKENFRNGIIEIDQLIYCSKFGWYSNDLANLIKYYFKPINLITFSIKDYFSYSKELIESLPSTLESIVIKGNNSLELYSLSNLSRFKNLKNIQIQFHIHDILYHLGITNNFINNSNRIKFKESEYYSEVNELRNPCFKLYNENSVFPYGYSINRLCSVSEDWYEMCESLTNNQNLINLSIGNSCILEEGIDPLRRYMNNDKFYINSKGKEKYYSSEEEYDRFDLEERIESESDLDSNNENNETTELEYINCSVIDDGSGGTIVFGGIPNKNNSDLSSSSEEENDEDYIYDDSDVARCEKKITNRFKKKKKRKEKQYQEYLQFLKDRESNENNQFKTNYYKIFNEFSLPKSFTQPLIQIITTNKSIQSLELRNFDIDINILSSFKNNLNLINLIFENVLTNIQLEIFLDSILPTINNLKYLKINGIIKSSQNYTNNLNNLILKFKNLNSINFDFNNNKL